MRKKVKNTNINYFDDECVLAVVDEHGQKWCKDCYEKYVKGCYLGDTAYTIEWDDENPEILECDNCWEPIIPEWEK